MRPVNRVQCMTFTQLRICLTAVVAMGLLGACASGDGREMSPPRPDQGASISPNTTAKETVGQPSFTMTVTGPWSENSAIDPRYTCDGPGVSPPLAWTPGPDGTASYAVVMSNLDDPEHVYWVMANISPTATSLQEGRVPSGAISGMNDAEAVGYDPPCPPAGSTQRFTASVYALSTAVALNDGVMGTEMLDAIEEATLTVASTYFTISR
jgi:Raf kinase inhibitor-like YbhB/YbcL family protein